MVRLRSAVCVQHAAVGCILTYPASLGREDEGGSRRCLTMPAACGYAKDILPCHVHLTVTPFASASSLAGERSPATVITMPPCVH